MASFFETCQMLLDAAVVVTVPFQIHDDNSLATREDGHKSCEPAALTADRADAVLTEFNDASLLNLTWVRCPFQQESPAVQVQPQQTQTCRHLPHPSASQHDSLHESGHGRMRITRRCLSAIGGSSASVEPGST